MTSPSGTTPTRDASLLPWLGRANARLRWVYGSCADLPEEERAMHVTAELEHLAGELPAGRRREGLQELLKWYPEPARPAAPAEVEVAAMLGMPFYEVPAGLEGLAERLAQAWGEAGEDERARCRETLAAAGVLAAAPEGTVELGEVGPMISVPAPARQSAALAIEVLRARLDMDADQPVDLQRVFRLLNTLVQLLEQLDEMGWAVWAMISKGPGTRIRQGAFAGRSRLSARAGAYLSGQHRDNPEVFIQTLETGVRLLTALINGIGLGGKEFCQALAGTLAPEEIERSLRAQTTRLRGVTAEMRWAAFQDLMDQMPADVIEQNLHSLIAKAVETLFHAEGRSL